MHPVVAIGLVTLAALGNTGAAAAEVTPADFMSCDAQLVRQAAGRILDDPATMRQPVVLFLAAQGMRIQGDREQAAFLYLLARLRATRQSMVEGGEMVQVTSAMMMSIAPLVMPDLAADPEFARSMVDRVLAWDKSRPDAFRERAMATGGKPAEDILALEASFERFADEIRAKQVPDAARKSQQESERRITAMRDAQCQPGTLDATDVAAAQARIEREAVAMVTAHPLVMRRAGGAVRTASLAASSGQRRQLPHRLTLTVNGVTGPRFYAEVEVAAEVGADRKLTAVSMSLACVTSLWIGQRQANGDVCDSDPAAERP